MKKFKGMLLACDMDGTLLDDSKQIPAENLRALQYFTKQGGRLSLATGRSPHAIGIYIDQLPVNAPYSVMNGSLICDENRQDFVLLRNAVRDEKNDRACIVK